MMNEIEKYLRDLGSKHGLRIIYEKLILILNYLRKQLTNLKECKKQLKNINKKSNGYSSESTDESVDDYDEDLDIRNKFS